MEDPGKLMASYPAETGGDSGGYSAYEPYDPYYSDPRPTSGARHFWWLADSVPFGRVFVVAALVVALIGVGYFAGKLATTAVTYQSESAEQPVLAALVPAAAAAEGESIVGAGSDEPVRRSLPELTSPQLIPRQKRLPWRDWQEGSAAYDLTNRGNVIVSQQNHASMEQYSRRIIDSSAMQRAPSQELYYVKHRTPAFGKLARFGDKPVEYVMPGTPLLIQQFDSRWALVMPPGRAAVWVRATTLTTERTHRYWY